MRSVKYYVLGFCFLSKVLFANSCIPSECYAPYPDLSGIVVGVQGGWSHLLTPDVRDRTVGAGLRGYERTSTSWGVFAGYNWTFCNCLFTGLQAAYFDNGIAKITYDSSNQYEFHSDEWDILAQLGFVSCAGYDIYVKLGGGRVKEKYKRIFAFSGVGDPRSSKTRICPIFAFGLGKIMPCRVNAFVEFKLTLGKDTSKVTDGLEDIDPGVGFTDVLREVATVTSIHFGVAKYF